MNKKIITQDGKLITDGLDLEFLGAVADEFTKDDVFSSWYSEVAESTRQTYGFALLRWVEYLGEAGHYADVDELRSDAAAWSGVSHGLVKQFLPWMLSRGYSISTINLCLTAIRKHISMANEAGTVDEETYSLIRGIKGFHKAKRVDNIESTRKARNIPTRRPSTKKAEPTKITLNQAKQMKDPESHPDTAKGRRDRLIFCLLIDFGLRASEVADLKVDNVNLEAGTITFYRRKVSTTQTFRMTQDVQEAMEAYWPDTLGPGQYLLRTSNKSGRLGKPYLAPIDLTNNVQAIGKRVLGITSLSSHDLRHHFVTAALRAGTPKYWVKSAGGWRTDSMVDYYSLTSEIANEGVILPD